MLLGGIFSFENTTGFFWWCWKGGCESSWGLLQAEEKGWEVFFRICCTASYQRQQERQGIALQFSEILLREMIATFDVEIWTNSLWRSLGSPFCYFRGKLSYDPITVQSIQVTPRQALGTPSCAETSPFWYECTWNISFLMWMCHSLIPLPQETVTWVKMRLVWQAWLKLGKNTHQWFKIFEEDLLVSRAQKTVSYKAPLPKKKFTLGL